jgi:hypothetical protein|tara:strand:- start:12 stop:197 length:186 start_codon:yes stop_codon:yes gene_type:complete
MIIIDGVKYKACTLASTGKPQMAGVWNYKGESRSPKLVQNYTNRQTIERLAGGSKPNINSI